MTVIARNGRKATADLTDSMLSPETLARAILFQLHERNPGEGAIWISLLAIWPIKWSADIAKSTVTLYSAPCAAKFTIMICWIAHMSHLPPPDVRRSIATQGLAGVPSSAPARIFAP